MERTGLPLRSPHLVVLTILCLVGLFVSEAVLAAPAAWPAKKGELCWDANVNGEHSLVIAQITNMGAAHYLFHGLAYRSGATPGPLQPINGNAEIDATDPDDIRIIGALTKTKINTDGSMEIYTGELNLAYDGLGGTAQGIFYICDLTVPVNTPTTCTAMNGGPAVMTLVDCP